MPHSALVTLAEPISPGTGPGLFLRLVVAASIVGVLLLVWILARAGRSN
ncbi:hypothetical protein [Streptomyces tateyamensis]|nr:hypothetical protein [Streptomyces tateyamensis]